MRHPRDCCASQFVEAVFLSVPLGHRGATECDVGEAVPSAAAQKNRPQLDGLPSSLRDIVVGAQP